MPADKREPTGAERERAMHLWIEAGTAGLPETVLARALAEARESALRESRAEVERLRGVLRRWDGYRDALLAREYEPESPVVRELLDETRVALAPAKPERRGGEPKVAP